MSPAAQAPAAIEVERLSFTYGGAGEPAVRELDFAVGRGEIFGFLGPSGAGKSTTQKILIGLLRGYRGRAAVLGRDLAGWRADDYARIGVSFELPNHFSKLTALENLTYFGALYGRPVRPAQEVLESVGLAGDARLRVAQLSKGMKGRLSIARSLLHDPELLFWDEPTAGLDPANARRIRDLARACREDGRTIFLTTHDMTLADELCDRVAFLVDGRIAGAGAPRDLKLRHGAPVVRVGVRTAAGTAERDFPLAGLADDGEFLALLRGGNVQTIHTLEATLEEVFLRVTGRGLA